MKILGFNPEIRQLLITIIFIGACGNLFSQEKTIRLQDENSGDPVTDVYFQYAGEIGFSDKNGVIILHYAKDQSLFLSHIRYGKVQLTAEELKEVFESGLIQLKASGNILLPITLIQVHPGAGEKNRLEISAQNKLAHDAGELLESVAAISTIRKSGAYGFDPVLRGFKYDQINLVLDGAQTATAACPNRMDPASSQIPINMITQAEVLKGPYNLRYGNAFGGTINFKSSSPEFRSKTTPVGRLGTSYESNGNIFRTEGVGGISGQKFELNLFGAYSTGKDYTDGDGMDVAARFNRLNWGGKIAFKPGKSQTLGILVSNNIAKDVDFPALPMDLREDNTWLINARHSVQFYDKILTSWNTNVYGTFVDHLMDNYDKMLVPRTVDAETKAETTNYGGRSELFLRIKNNNLYTGIDYRFESADGYRTREMLMGPMAGKKFMDNVWQDAQLKKIGIFGEFQLISSDLHLVLSGRLDYNRSKINDPDPRFSEIYDDLESDHLNPSLSIGGTKMLNQKTSLGLWMGRARRSPGIAERYINQFPIGLDPYEMLGNPQLNPEINNQVDLVFQYRTNKTNLNVNLFTSFLRDYISSEIREDLKPAMPTSPGVRQFVNIEKSLMAGFEFTWKQMLLKNIEQDLRMAYTYGQDRVMNEPLPEIPPFEFRYQLTASFLQDKLQPEIMFRRAFKQDRIATSYGETETPGFNVVNARITWLLNDVFTATGGIDNIFDAAYYEHLARSVRSAEARPIYSPGRSFYVTLTISFL